MIRELASCEIDSEKWNKCVQQSENGLLYGFSWYWNAVAPRWRAWVIDDYDAVFPIAEQGVWPFRKCYQPWFLQKSDLYNSRSAPIEETKSIYSLIVKKYFSGYCSVPAVPSISNVPEYIVKHTHVLPLTNSYHDIYIKYRRNTKRNLYVAQQCNLQIATTKDIDTFIFFLQTYLGNVIPKSKLQHIKNLADALLLHSCGAVYEVRNSQQQLLAMALFGWEKQRMHFLVCASSPEGQQQNAMTLLVDSVIQQSISHFSMFDFCGSMLPGVAYFNSGFGATEEKYYVLKF